MFNEEKLAIRKYVNSVKLSIWYLVYMISRKNAPPEKKKLLTNDESNQAPDINRQSNGCYGERLILFITTLRTPGKKRKQ